jgi:hypothetical protein
MNLSDRVTLLVKLFHGGNTNAAARALGVKQPTLFHIMSGRAKNPRSDLIRTIAFGFGVPSDWLLTGSGPGPLDIYAPSLAEVEELPANVIVNWTLNSGRFQWLNYLRVSLQLSEQAYSAWQFVPTQGIARGTVSLVDTSIFAGGPDERSHPPDRKPMELVLNAALDSSYRTWHAVITHAVLYFGVDNMRRRMEELVPDARLGFIGLAIAIARGVTTPAEHNLVLAGDNVLSGGLTVADLQPKMRERAVTPSKRGPRPKSVRRST